MRIVWHLWRDISNRNAGGAEVYENAILCELSRRGHDVTAIVGGDLDLRSLPRPYRVVPNGGTYSQYLLAPLTRRRSTAGADVIVDSSNGMTFFSPLTTGAPTVELVHHVHVQQWEDYFRRPVADVGRFLERRAMPHVYRHNIVIAVSDSTATDLIELGIPPEHVRVVTAGAEQGLVPGTESAEPSWLALGRLVPNKQLHILLDIWERVHHQVGGTLRIAGDGPDRAGLAARHAEGVEILGRISDADKDRLLGEAWCLVHTAKHEGWGMVINEAAARGRPTLAFNVPGVRDAVIDRTTGLLATDEDEFAKLWIELAGDVAWRAELGEGAQRRAASLSWETSVDRIEAVLREAVATQTSGRIGGSGRTGRAAPVRVPRTERVANLGPGGDAAGSGVVDHSVVIPAFDEESRLPDLLTALPSFVNAATTEVLVVDDGSSDGTARVAMELLADWPGRHNVIKLPQNRGKGAAVRRGVREARGSTILFLDADNATDLAGLHGLYTRLLAPGPERLPGAVFASRSASGARVIAGTRGRRLMGVGYNSLVRLATGTDLSDTQCGCKLFDARVAKLAFRLSYLNGYAFDAEILRLLGLLTVPVAEHPVTWTQIDGSKVSALDPARMAFDTLRVSRARPRALLPFITVGSAAVDLEGLVRVGDLVGHQGDRQIAILPFSGHIGAEAVSRRLSALGISDVRSGYLPPVRSAATSSSLEFLASMLHR